MIVRNESANMVRFLNSVVSYIDCYVICDTGSTDATIQTIQEYFTKRPDKRGHVLYEPFRNFGVTRTFAFTKAKELYPSADFYLFLDADMVFQSPLSPVEFRRGLIDRAGDIYLIFQGSDHFSTKNTRLCRGGAIAVQSSYTGVTHEYLNYPSTAQVVTIDQSVAFIRDIGDGGSKGDKFKRDIRLLEEDLFRDPKNGRTLFYLGNSYKDDGQDEKAIEVYKQKIQLADEWFEEIWYSYYNIGCCYRNLNRFHEAIPYWLQAFTHNPRRIENLYEIVKEYRKLGKYHLAYEFYIWAARINSSVTLQSLSSNSAYGSIAFPKTANHSTDFLFTQRDVYDWKLDYEVSIVGYYYNPQNLPLPSICMNLISKPAVYSNGESIYRNILNNYKFYVQCFPTSKTETTVMTKLTHFRFPELLKEFSKSTPSIVIHQGQLWVNLRYVNYSIDKDGHYVNADSIISRNVLFNIYTGLHFEWESPMEQRHNQSSLYKGVEDVRLFSKDGILYYNANRGVADNQIQVEHGILDIGKKTARGIQMQSPVGNPVEKNWVMFQSKESKTIQVVYKWFPIVIGHFEKDRFETKHVQREGLPAFFNDVRGSTNGTVVGDEIWFLCHLVSFETRRHYYHLFVVLDATTFQLKRFSHLYKISNSANPVEYVLGMIPCKDTDDRLQMIISYSVLDKTSEFRSIQVDDIEWNK